MRIESAASTQETADIFPLVNNLDIIIRIIYQQYYTNISVNQTNYIYKSNAINKVMFMCLYIDINYYNYFNLKISNLYKNKYFIYA